MLDGCYRCPCTSEPYILASHYLRDLAANDFLDETLDSDPTAIFVRTSGAKTMRKNPLFVAFVIWAFVLAAVGQNQTVQSSTQTATSAATTSGSVLQDGTPVKLRFGTTVSSSTAHVGDSVDLEVLEDVTVGNTVVIQKGATAIATVTDAHSKKSMGRAGKLDINIDYVRLADGEKAALKAVQDVKGGGHQGAMTGAMVATSLVFFPAAPLFLFVHGKDISIPKGTQITAFANGDMPLVMARFQPGASTGIPIVAGTASATTELDITSKPDGAEISIDGNFVGNTPSNVTVTCATHTISIRQAGYHVWERTISTSGGKVNLAATLTTTGATNAVQPAIYDSESLGDAARAAKAKHTAQTVETAAPQN